MLAENGISQLRNFTNLFVWVADFPHFPLVPN